MRKIWLLACMMLLADFIQGQSILQKRDSLITLLQQKEHDTLRALHLVQLSATYPELAPDTALLMATEALRLSRKINFKSGEALSLLQQGWSFSFLGNQAIALEKALEALRLGEKINDAEIMQACLNGIGVIYKREGDYRQALLYYFKAKDYAEKYNQSALPPALSNIGGAYFELGKYDSAKLFVQQAHDKASAQKNQRVMGVAMVIMGDINLEEGHPALALEYYQLGSGYTKNTASLFHLIRGYMGMAKAFAQTKQADSSLVFARQAFSIANENKFLGEIPVAGEFIYEHYKRTRNSDSALFYLELCRLAKDSLNNRENQMKMQALNMEEKLRQQEKQQEEEKAKEQRVHNLQYAAIAFAVVILLIVFLLLSHSVIANQTSIRFLGVLSLLIVFEFLNLLLHPYLGNLTHHQPIFMLGAMVIIAALLIPLHHKLEHWIIHKLVEKNNGIKLAAAKKIIEKLEGKANSAAVKNSMKAQQ
jgi:tetratricopeptide (TPR) repeat protein